MSASIKMPERPPAEVLAATPPAVVAYIEALENVLKQILEIQEKQAKELREAHRQATPFRRNKNKDKRGDRKKKKAGRKGGHSQQKRSAPDEVDEQHDAPHPDRCPCGCGELITVDFYEQLQEDIVVRRVTRKLTIYVGECSACGKRVEGRHPFQTSTARGAASHHIGPTALALAAHLHYGEGVPFDKVREHLEHLGLKMTTSTLVRAMQRLGKRAQGTFKELLDQVLAQEVLHIDETGWSVAGEPHNLWVITGGDYTIYFVRKTRSADEVSDFLKDFSGILVTDGAKAYDKLGKKLMRALCLLHLRRNVKGLEEKCQRRGKAFPRDLIDWLDDAIATVGEREHRSEAFFASEVDRLERSFQKLLKHRSGHPPTQKMVERLRTWQDAVLRCLRDGRVPATNNKAERQIRPAVVTRKRGGCSRSQTGARTLEIITSLYATARQQKADFVEWVTQLLCHPDPSPAIPFW